MNGDDVPINNHNSNYNWKIRSVTVPTTSAFQRTRITLKNLYTTIRHKKFLMFLHFIMESKKGGCK